MTQNDDDLIDFSLAKREDRIAFIYFLGVCLVMVVALIIAELLKR